MQLSAADTMKTSQSVLKKPDWSDVKRSGRFGRWGLNGTERKSRVLEISIQKVDGPAFVDIRKRSSIYLQAAAKLADSVHVLGRSKHLVGLSKPRHAARTALPPISRSRNTTDALPGNRKKPAEQENQVLHMMVTQHGRVNQESNKDYKIRVNPAAGNKTVVKDSETRSRRIDDQPPATLTPAPANHPRRQKNDVSDPSCRMKAEPDASVCAEKQQRRFCSDDSAFETESEADRERPTEDSDDEEYYTDQRISEWILKVNSSLFSTGSEEPECSKPAEEQDVATIKIIYSGD